MELARLIAALSEPASYPGDAGSVEVHQTHISAVFLAGPFAYKIKKPVDFGFLDYRTLERRRHYCEEEVRLNRRLAPGVYLGVVPVAAEGPGVRVEGRGEPIEWAVKMVRLPDASRLGESLRRGEVGRAEVESLAVRLAAFHASAEAGAGVAAYGRFAVVAGNARDNFAQSEAHVGRTISRAVFDRLRALTERSLSRLEPLVEARAARGIPRDGHGDLRLDHVYLFPDRPPPGDLIVIDCIEFHERFRRADPVADAAFLVMDLIREGRRDLARAFADAYLRAAGDEEGRELLPFYTAYRAAVRGKVEGIEATEAEVPMAERLASLGRARAHWLLALVEMESPDRRPCLVMVAGLPGTGKSTLAAGLAERSGFRVIRSDVVRKELDAGGLGSALYSAETTARTYAECLRRAEEALFEGGRVLVDANFRREDQRRAFLDAAMRWGVPGVVLLCRARPEIARGRLDARRGDASDADWSVYLRVAASWEEPGRGTSDRLAVVNCDGRPERSLDLALDALRDRGLSS